MELQGQKKRKIGIKKPSTSLKSEKIVKPKDKVNSRDLSKKRILNRDGKRKKKESLGTETEESVSWTNRPGAVAGEKAYMYPDDASGSEYVPSDSDFVPSSEGKQILFLCNYKCCYMQPSRIININFFTKYPGRI